MPRILFLFMDGVGLGANDPSRNPMAIASMPTLSALLGGKRLIAEAAPREEARATLLSIDARLGVEGTPQSASGQAALLTGRNVPAEIGGHYGPKPNRPIASILEAGSVFMEVSRRGGRVALLNAYPPRYFESIRSRRRLYSSIPMAAHAAGVGLKTSDDLRAQQALSADFTAAGWVAQPDFPPAPVLTPYDAGRRLADLAGQFEMSWFDYWPSDYAGHRGVMADAISLLELFDHVVHGLIDAWDDAAGLVVITSDHGNLEDLAKRGHTLNPVPGLLIGSLALRRDFSRGLKDLTGFAPAMLRTIFPPPA